MDAILTVIDDWGQAMDSKQTITAIFFDFAKAFDLVDHELLLEKLVRLNFPAWLVSWIAAYLTGRRQRVKVGEFESEWKDVVAGVIQGSVLGPILFIIFISDINKYLPDGASLEKYADDILNYIIGKSTSTNLPQEVVDAVQRWCLDNKMRLNTDKCKVLHFQGNDTKPSVPRILLHGKELEVVKSYKYLGVELNNTLDWSQQWQRVKSLTSSIPFLIKQLRRTGFERRILVNVYRSLALSHFHYSAPLLASASVADKNEMKAFQKRLLRIIGINATEALDEHKITDIDVLIEKAALGQVRKVLCDQHHPLSIKHARIHPRSGELVFKVPLAKTEHYRSSIVPYSVRVFRDGKASLYAETKRASAKRQPAPKKAKPKKKAPTPKKLPMTRELATTAICTKQPQPSLQKAAKQQAPSGSNTAADTRCPHCSTTKLFKGVRGLNVHLRTCLKITEEAVNITGITPQSACPRVSSDQPQTK